MIFTDNNEPIMGNATEAAEFKIAASPKAFKILSSNLYKNKIRAIVRELSCNAIDAHVLVNQAKPFKIKAPTMLDPRFVIRDFGPGLSPKDIVDVYTVYFMSTKTDSNDQIGGLGLGAKTPFSYAPAFNITSFHDGTVYGYSAVLTENGPVLNKTFEEPMNADDLPGLEVIVPVRQEDLNSWANEIRYVLRPFGDVKPDIDGDITVNYFDVESVKNKTMFHLPQSSERQGVYALYGRIVYPLTDIPGMNAEWLKTYGGVYYFNFDLGELDIAPSREELSLDQRTIENICKRVNSINDEAFTKATKEIFEEANPRKAWRLFNGYSTSQRNAIMASGRRLSNGMSISELVNFVAKAKVQFLMDGKRYYYFNLSPSRKTLSIETRKLPYSKVSVIDKIGLLNDGITVVYEDTKMRTTAAVRSIFNAPKEYKEAHNIEENLFGAMFVKPDEIDIVQLEALLKEVFFDDEVNIIKYSDMPDLIDHDPQRQVKTVDNKKIVESRPAYSNVQKYTLSSKGDNAFYSVKEYRMTASELDKLEGLAVGSNRDTITDLNGGQLLLASHYDFRQVSALCGIDEFYVLRPSVIQRFKSKPNPKIKCYLSEVYNHLKASLDSLDKVNHVVLDESGRFMSRIRKMGLIPKLFGKTTSTKDYGVVTRYWHYVGKVRGVHCPIANDLNRLIHDYETYIAIGEKNFSKLKREFEAQYPLEAHYITNSYDFSTEIMKKIKGNIK
ncbi:rIIA protector from prophage-induced early lysis [Acinetobacter phage Ac42]|uniref:RIIA lysis inhibitor n=1 Tax=Acinetobacter phage Ac42 TaxID=762660 RepID=UPI0001EBCC63|nr:RIIA lysis inhibitor [Acinetobacter phage Ac42]ADI96239.1 rIIA protector from prophage-induced early lysis [Acinetobacter phage Ac42]